MRRDKTKGVIRGAELNFVGAPNAFVGIWITPVTSTASAYTVQTSQILRDEANFDIGPNFEVRLLRAIQADVGGK